MDTLPSPSAQRTRSLTYLGLFFLVAVGTCTLLGYWLWQARAQLIDQARTDSTNLAWVLEDHIDSTLRRAEAELRRLGQELPPAALNQGAVPAFRREWSTRLESHKNGFPEISNFYIFDAQGSLLYSSDPQLPRFSIADRPHFTKSRDQRHLELVFSEVVVARTTGHSTMAILRPLRDKDGALLGLVTALIDFSYFQALFDTVNIGPHGLIALRTSDQQKLVLRRPHLEEEINKPVRSLLTERIAAGEKAGNIRFASTIDGYRRTASFRVLRNYPFNINVAIADTDILAPWQRNAWVSILSALGVLALLALLLRRLWRSESNRNQVLLNLQEREQNLIEAKNAAETANVAKSTFLASMSHELRTPLNAVLGYAQLLEMDKDLDPNVRANAGEIEKAGQHLLSLVNDVLDLARIESGRLEMALEDVPLDAVVAECMRLIQPRAQELDITIEAPPTSVMVSADRLRLRQVLLNLLSNAIKYNRHAGRVSVHGSVQPNKGYRIAITDTGHGISTARMSELFMPFNRLGAERGSIEGTGIGLVITKLLVEIMHGSIGVESTPGTGSTFWVELPMATAQAA